MVGGDIQRVKVWFYFFWGINICFFFIKKKGGTLGIFFFGGGEGARSMMPREARCPDLFEEKTEL